MPTDSTPVYEDIVLSDTLTDPTDFQVVTMVNTHLGSNTFTAANGALRSPNWPGLFPTTNMTSYTVFQGIPGVYRVISGVIRTESGFDHIRFMDGIGLAGPMITDTTSSASNVATPVSFVSGVGQTFTVSARGDSIGSYAAAWSLTVRGYRAVTLSPGQISAEGGVLRAADASGTFLLRQASRGAADVQVFTANGTWTKPPGVNAVRVFLVGGGGGGGSGRRGLGSTLRTGGGGGSGGALTVFTAMPASVFGATEPVVVGSGGPGGAGQTVNSTNGNPGTGGGQSSFSSGATLMRAAGGNGGTGGTSTTGGTGGAATTGDLGTNNAGGTGGTLSTAPTAPTTGLYMLTMGGGGGGAITATNTVGAGASSTLGNGSVANSFTNAGATATTPSANGAVQSTTANAGISAPPNRPFGGSGGGGGVTTSAFTVSGSGGQGGNYGAGGGGGAASVDGVTSGAGGQGAPGLVVIVSW